MSPLPTRNKDPDASEIFSVDWTLRLAGATLITSTWVVPAGITKVSESNTTTHGTVKLSGGTAGETYRCTNRVETSAGEQLDQSLDIYIAEA